MRADGWRAAAGDPSPAPPRPTAGTRRSGLLTRTWYKLLEAYHVLLPPVFVLPTINNVNLVQANSANGANLAIGSVGAAQTLVWLQGNSANIFQGR